MIDTEKELLFIHYWKKELTNDELQRLLDNWPHSFKTWCILLEEKLTRNEITQLWDYFQI